MAGIRAKILGLNRLKKKLRRIPLEQRDGIGRAVGISVLDMQRETRRLIKRGPPRTGVVVTRGRRPHQRSGPGEPPKTDTGRLAGSIFALVDADKLGGEVGTDVKYGRFLEFGTVKMAARPWLHPTFDRLKPKISNRIAKAIIAANRKATR